MYMYVQYIYIYIALLRASRVCIPGLGAGGLSSIQTAGACRTNILIYVLVYTHGCGYTCCVVITTIYM